jgi:hypothetical protein
VAIYTEGDVGGDGGRGVTVPSVDQVEERVGGGGLIALLLELAEAHVVDDEQVGTGPGLEAPGVGAVGEAGVEVVEQVDAAGVAEGEGLLAGAQAEGLEEVALAGAAIAGEDEVVFAADEVEAGELEEEGLVEVGLEVPVEGFEGLLLAEAAGDESTLDAGFELAAHLVAQEVLEQRGGARALAGGPGELLVELGEGVGQSEEGEVSSESLDDEVVADGRVVAAAGSLGHEVSLSPARAAPRGFGPPGRRS